MNSNKAFVLSGITAIYIVCLFLFSFFKMNLYANILAPVGSLLAGVILLKNYFKCRPKETIKLVFLVYSIACFFWMTADLLFMISYLAGWDTSSSFIFSLYPVTNFLLAVCSILLAIYLFKRWSALQLALDCLIFTLCAFRSIWYISFGKTFVFEDILYHNGIFPVSNVLLDFVIVIGVALWMATIRNTSKPVHVQVICLGTALFAADNLLYSCEYLYGFYHSNSPVDVIYILALLIIALGSEFRGNFDPSRLDRTDYDTYTHKYTYQKGLALCLFPVITIAVKGFVLTELFMYALILSFYLICTFYIRMAITNETLLKREKELNRTLEEKVELRTSELIKKNETLDIISNQDTVTKLYNRRYFGRALQEKFNNLKPHENIALLFIDLDRFKTINDTYGHLVGDEVLVEISRRLKLWNKEGSILARLGGDEFVLAICGQFGYRQVELIAERIIRSCTEKIEIDEYVFHVTMSVGISIYPTDALNINALMTNADIAMYQAKAKGFNQYISFNSMLEESNRRKNEIEMLLRKADFDKEFELYYQPQIDLSDFRMIGMEALIRWKTPDGFEIPPADFIPIAEEIDYIMPIGEWVMDKAIRQIVQWNTAYHTQYKMGINVSPKQLDNKNFIRALKDTLQDNRMNPGWLDVEITENIAMVGKYRLTQVATMFNEMGISISIDDFGTGYSSLSYLKYFPFDRIKIAKPLIDAISEHSYDLQIVKAIILLAKSIGIKTIAEGVETQNQLNILTMLGCEEVQGFYYSTPVPASEFEQRFLKADSIKHFSEKASLC